MPPRPFLLSCARGLLLAACTVLVLPGAEPAPATVTKIDAKGGQNAFDNAFVVREDRDGIEFAVGDPKSPSRVTLKPRTYSVDYNEQADLDWLQAKTRLAENKIPEAQARFTKAAGGSKYQWVREAAALQGATCALQLQKWDDALALIQAMETEAPKSLRLPEAIYLRGKALEGKGDAGAAAVYAGLKAKEKDLGKAALLLGTRGEASLLRGQKKPAEAAAAAAALWAKLSPAEDNEAWTGLGLDLAGDLAAAGKAAEAATTWARLAYGATDPVVQSKAQLGWAKALAKGDAASAMLAFDHAAVAALLKGGDAAAGAEAAKLAQSLYETINRDAGVAAADKLEYRKYMTAVQR
jgi:hypothetical protein